MQKIVINKCYGGFSLSDAGMRRYAEIKGIKIYPEPNRKYPAIMGNTYWTTPPESRLKDTGSGFYALNVEERKAYNKAYSDQTISCYDIPRDDPALVQTVKELGEGASGRLADLKIVKVPDGVEWEIEEYDGMEHVAQKHETWG